MLQIACVFLVDPTGALLMQLRDDRAPHFPNMWGPPGGAVEEGETPLAAALRELWEETALRPSAELRLFTRQEVPATNRVKHYFYGPTTAKQSDVVLGEGAAMLFIPAAEAPNRPLTPGTAETLAHFLTSPEYAQLTTR
ncbi:NUDIX domain-containing protein [Actinoplanes sp. NPDC026619]|uniref:NUDIX hydrolase n=1 Tax=Actinoplanes sp. NPDC026619 TaxID=3155798 RepID=UPI0033E61B6C